MTSPRIGAVLSLTGRFARFGAMAELGLRAWAELDPGAEVLVADDGGEPDRVRSGLRDLAARCDVLLGPYSTVLARAAVEVAVETGTVIWNHGGSGDDVQDAGQRRVISVLTPTSGYAEPFVEHLAGLAERAPLLLVHGEGSFGRQVVAGAEAVARRLGVPVLHGGLDAARPDSPWDLFTAGTFEHDLDVLTATARLGTGPRFTGSVAAGVQQFADAVDTTENMFGVAQWARGLDRSPRIGPTEREFVSAYLRLAGTTPDYPAVQAAAAATLASHCVDRAGSTAGADVFAAASRLRTSTMFGEFAIDPRTGRQVAHRMALVRWAGGVLRPVR